MWRLPHNRREIRLSARERQKLSVPTQSRREQTKVMAACRRCALAHLIRIAPLFFWFIFTILICLLCVSRLTKWQICICTGPCLFLSSPPPGRKQLVQSDRRRFIKIPFEKCVDTSLVITHMYMLSSTHIHSHFPTGKIKWLKIID